MKPSVPKSRRLHKVGCILLTLAPLLAATAVQSSEPALTSKQGDEILGELRKIRELLERKESAPTVTAAQSESASVALRDSYTLGRADAPLTIIEFADYQCPYCRRFHLEVFEDLKKNYVDTGKLRYIARDLPLPIHDRASEAANAARCAGEQTQFWAMRHALIVNAQRLGHDELVVYARELQLDVPAFVKCLDEKRYDSAIQRDASDATEVGVVGTPTFLLGRSGQVGHFDGIKIVGSQPYSVYAAKIKSMLEREQAVRP